MLSFHAYLISQLFLEPFEMHLERPLYIGTPSVYVHRTLNSNKSILDIVILIIPCWSTVVLVLEFLDLG